MKSAAFKSALSLVCFAVLPLVLLAQATSSGSNNAPPARTAEDVEWETIRLDAQPGPGETGTPPADEAARKKARADRASNLLTKADRAREFHRKHSGHGKAGEARKLEALLLLNAVHNGETSVEGRLEQAIDEIRRDPSLPEAVRAEVVGTANFMGALKKHRQGEDIFATYEAAARALIMEFPGQPQGYESLVAIARDTNEMQGRALARELLDMPAPESVKRDARLLLARYRLVGDPLDNMLADAGDKEATKAVKSNRPTVIYTWATWSPGSVALGQMLAKRNLGGVNVLGINLDENTAAAQALAATSGLPGTLLYDTRGGEGALARRLRLSGAPQVYFVDAAGVVRDVRGTENLEQKLTTHGL